MKDQPVYRCEVQEIRRLNYFFEIFYSSLLLALGAKVHEYFSVMVSGHDSKYKGFKIFSHITQSVFLVFRTALKRLAFNSSKINEDQEY